MKALSGFIKMEVDQVGVDEGVGEGSVPSCVEKGVLFHCFLFCLCSSYYVKVHEPGESEHAK